MAGLTRARTRESDCGMPKPSDVHYLLLVDDNGDVGGALIVECGGWCDY